MKNIILLFFLAGFTIPSQAQWSDALPILDSADLSIIGETARMKMTNRPVGTILMWENKKTGSSGSVELLDRFTRDNRECRTNKHTIKPEKESVSEVIITICNTADGDWQWSPPRPK